MVGCSISSSFELIQHTFEFSKLPCYHLVIQIIFLAGLCSRTVELKEFGNNNDASLKTYTQIIVRIFTYLRVYMYIFTHACSIYYICISIYLHFFTSPEMEMSLVLRFKVLPQQNHPTLQRDGTFHH